MLTLWHVLGGRQFGGADRHGPALPLVHRESRMGHVQPGTLYQHQGVDDLLQAFAVLPAEIAGRSAYLLMAGNGPDRDRLQRLCRELALDARLRWVGRQDDPAPFYGLPDVMVCPSRHETLGNVILEAWSHHLPVISTRTPSAWS